MSWQSRLLALHLRAVVKPWLERIEDPETFAADVAKVSPFLMRPPFLRQYERPEGMVWFSVGETETRKVILYLHGGAYVAGRPESYAGVLGQISRLSEIEVCAPRYRLAPLHPFPAAYDDAVRAWATLREMGYRPRDIVIGGDSAGGGLALALLAHLCAQGEPPAGAFAFSPWTDLALTGASLAENMVEEAMLPASRIEEVVALYLGDSARNDPRASPLYGEFPGCCPVLIHYGADEILRDDSRRMAERLRSFGAEVTEVETADVPHVWHLLDGWIPEARASLEQTAEFVQASFAESSR